MNNMYRLFKAGSLFKTRANILSIVGFFPKKTFNNTQHKTYIRVTLHLYEVLMK